MDSVDHKVDLTTDEGIELLRRRANSSKYATGTFAGISAITFYMAFS